MVTAHHLGGRRGAHHVLGVGKEEMAGLGGFPGFTSKKTTDRHVLVPGSTQFLRHRGFFPAQLYPCIVMHFKLSYPVCLFRGMLPLSQHVIAVSIFSQP